MENRPIGPEEQDDTNDSAGTKKKRGSTLSRYLSALKGKEASENDSEESGAEKPKRAQRLLSRLFPGIVERPAHLSPQETNDQEYEFNHEAWFGWARQAKQVESAPHTMEEEQVEIAAPETNERSEESIGTSSGAQPVAAERPESIPPTPETNDTPVSIPDAYVPNPIERDSRVAPSEQNIVRESEVPTSLRHHGEIPLRTSAETETIIERRGSNLLPIALVGAEYLGRKKADRKLEARVDKKIDATNEKQRRSEALQEELEHVVSQNKQQVEQLKKAQVHIERQTPRTPENREVAPTIIPATEIRRTPQSEAPAFTERDPIKREVIKPQNIAERVADAAEHDVPVERAFERSHEVKDDNPVATSAAASVGAVIAANAAVVGIPPVTQTPSSATTSGDKNLPFVSDADIAASYKQAAKMGFWTAICLIILGVIAYLMVRYI